MSRIARAAAIAVALTCAGACGGSHPSGATEPAPGGGGSAGPPDSAGVRLEHVPPKDHREETAMLAASHMGADPESRFGPLEVAADYLSYVRVTRKPFLSLVHANRWVHVYVNKIGSDAYVKGTPIPVGTIIVKASWLDDRGRPSNIEGPVYIMEKRPAGYAPKHGDWYYAIRWAHPPSTAGQAYGGPIYWRGKSPKVAFCYKCHDDYDRSLGGLVPSSVLPR
jgi:Cytochrome P460